MNGGTFLDTNVIATLLSGDGRKAEIAERRLAQGGTVSVQVLNELANVARRKAGLSWAEVAELVAGVRGLVAVEPLTAETHELGLALAERHGFSVYDAMIVAAALLAGCGTLLSEDMQDGMVVAGQLRVVNPFSG